jgi:hypothetical protein
MPTGKRKVIRKAAPVLSAAAAAGLFSVMGTGIAIASSAKPFVSQIVLSDEADGAHYAHLAATREFLGKGAGAHSRQRG